MGVFKSLSYRLLHHAITVMIYIAYYTTIIWEWTFKYITSYDFLSIYNKFFRKKLYKFHPVMYHQFISLNDLNTLITLFTNDNDNRKVIFQFYRDIKYKSFTEYNGIDGVFFDTNHVTISFMLSLLKISLMHTHNTDDYNHQLLYFQRFVSIFSFLIKTSDACEYGVFTTSSFVYYYDVGL